MTKTELPSHFSAPAEAPGVRGSELRSTDWLAEFDPSPEEIRAILKARKMRGYQRKHRGDKRSANDDAETLLMLLAWEAGEVSEGVLAKVLDAGDRVALRERKMRAIALGRSLAHALRILGPSSANDCGEPRPGGSA